MEKVIGLGIAVALFFLLMMGWPIKRLRDELTIGEVQFEEEDKGGKEQ